MIWDNVKDVPWRTRNAAVERALKLHLGQKPSHVVLSSYELAAELDPTLDKQATGKLAQLLARMAPFMEPLATHDGAMIYRYGRAWRRWQWHGQYKIGTST